MQIDTFFIIARNATTKQSRSKNYCSVIARSASKVRQDEAIQNKKENKAVFSLILSLEVL
jgi:hypothetical protein